MATYEPHPADPATFQNFTITCKKCGGTDVFVKDCRSYGGDETGTSGGDSLYCRGCGESEDISVTR